MARIYVTDTNKCNVHVFNSDEVVAIRFSYYPTIQNPESCTAILQFKHLHPDELSVACLGKDRDCDKDAVKFNEACESFIKSIKGDIWHSNNLWFTSSNCNYYKELSDSYPRKKVEVIISNRKQQQVQVQASNPIY